MQPLSRTKYIGSTRAGNVLKNYMSAVDRLNHDAGIYRGIRNFNKTYALVKPSQVKRKSRNTSNIYTALMDILPSWREWPKRSLSIICSSSVGYAARYSGPPISPDWESVGAVYCVLPKNESRIAICSADDIWNSFVVISDRWGKDSMDLFNETFETIFSQLLKFSGVLVQDDIKKFDGNQMKKFLSKADEITKETNALKDSLIYLENRYAFFITVIEDIRKYKNEKNLTWLEYFDELLNPIDNGFTLSTIEMYNPDSFREVWTDADCLLIRMSQYDSKRTRVANNYRLVSALVKAATGQETVFK